MSDTLFDQIDLLSEKTNEVWFRLFGLINEADDIKTEMLALLDEVTLNDAKIKECMGKLRRL